MKSIIISISIFLLLCGTLLFLGFLYLSGQTPKDVIDELTMQGRQLLYTHDMIETLSAKEMTRLYQDTCTRKCHSKDVIEKTPRTALEWDWIVTRMKAPDRADINDHHARAITEYLQGHFLSNIPTVLPEKTMQFVKRHLWKNDFGEDDLYLDIIYVPSAQLTLLPYLVASNTPLQNPETVFIVYINTHQGTIPPWDLINMATLTDGEGSSHKAITWQVVYEDGQHHHKQGILTFPRIDETKSTTLNVALQLPGIRARVFQWERPIPPFTGSANED